MGGFCGYGGAVWGIGEGAVGYWIVGVTSFQKIYGLYGLKHHIMEVRGGVTSRAQRVPDTRPEPEVFVDTRTRPDFFSKSSGISGIGYSRKF